MMKSALNDKSFPHASVRKTTEEQNMNKVKRGLTVVAGVLLICLLAIGTVSAYDVDTACTSLKEVVAGNDDLTALELVAEYSDGSVSVMKLWTESVINPEETLCARLEYILEEDRERNDLPRVILTLVSGEIRISYELSPKKSVFVELKQPVVFPDISAKNSGGVNDLMNIMNGLRYDYVLDHEYDNSESNPFTFYAQSTTNPATTLPVMTAESWVKKWSGIRWVDSCYSGDTKWNTKNVYAPGGPVTLQSGTYKQFANFEGYHTDYTWYEEYHDEADSFVIS